MIRKGTRNGVSYWFCHSCKHYFSGRSRVDSSAVYRYYAQGTYTIAQIAERLGISCSTVKHRMKNFPLSSTSIAPRTVALQMDTTYWGRNFGVVLFMDVATHRVLHFRFIYRKERIEDYLVGIAYLKRQGIRVSGVISDGLSGLRKALAPIPYQYCQFHQIQRIRQLLTNHPKHPASIALERDRPTAYTIRQKTVCWFVSTMAWAVEGILGRENILRKWSVFHLYPSAFKGRLF